MTVFFQNPGELDLDTVRVLGVSIKTNDSPIGYFGTGLKFAVATLLRTGHKVEIHTAGRHHQLSVRPGLIRGSEFDFVYLDDERLAFTTQLGRDWEVWQAYRELRSNAMDENGGASETQEPADTTIIVSGPEIDRVHQQAGLIFIESSPLSATDHLSVHSGASKHLYLRGVRAGNCAKPSIFTYSIHAALKLSEDRQVANYFEAELVLEKEIPRLSDASLLNLIISAPSGTLEHDLDFRHCREPSPAFFEAAERNYSDLRTNQSARLMLEEHRRTSANFDAAALRGSEERRLDAAIKIARYAGSDIDRADLKIVESLGKGVYGIYRNNTDEILIARSAIGMGDLFLAATLYEEWVHKTHKLDDCSREMQNFLFQQLMSLSDNAREGVAA